MKLCYRFAVESFIGVPFEVSMEYVAEKRVDPDPQSAYLRECPPNVHHSALLRSSLEKQRRVVWNETSQPSRCVVPPVKYLVSIFENKIFFFTI